LPEKSNGSLAAEILMSRRLEKITNRERTWYMPTVRRWPLALSRGDGSRVWDLDGNEYVDLTAGWGVTSIGHCHPEMVEALCDQARTLMHTTNVVYTEPQLDLAERLARIAPEGMQRTFFTSSGSEANEAALKLAARRTARSRFVAATGSFHGRTLGSLGVLGQEKHRGPWKSLVREAGFVPFGDAAAARSAIDTSVAAMIVEPIQGEGGVNVPPDGYLAELRRACDAMGALLIVDEIQTGMGRTGHWLALEHDGVRPDIITLGKGLGGGVPIAGFIATEAVMGSIQPGDHGGTYSGNPLVCRAACAVYDVIERENLVERAGRLGARAMGRLSAFAKLHDDRIESVRGRGLLMGVVLRSAEMAARIQSQIRERGVLVNLTAERVLRIFPALNIPDEDIDHALDVLEATIEEN
jgi:predicted acetylornithine/succinylornithine family transaminase